MTGRYIYLLILMAVNFCLASAEVLVIPASLKELDEEAFRDREEIESVVFESGSQIRHIPTGTFRGCRNLRQIRLPENLERIGAHAFAYCPALESIEFPKTLKRIGNNAFSRCSSLQTLYIPDSVVELESYAFSDCESLSRVRLPDNGSMLGELIFSGCCNLRLLVQPSTAPPAFDCNSFIFEPDEEELYRNCRLEVPMESTGRYQTAQGWELFFNNRSF